MPYTLNYGIFSPFKLAAKIEEETNQTEQPMLKTIEGIYQDGQIRFTEPPQDIGDRLRNTFIQCDRYLLVN